MNMSLRLIALAALTLNMGCMQQSGSNSNPSGSNESATPAATEIKDDVSQKDVIQVALGSKDHSTLVSAIKQAELVDPLKKSGPFTVFAPVNAAFDKLPEGTLADLMKPENKSKLADILEYHVSVGIFKEDMMQDGQKIGMVNSGNITINKVDGKIRINGKANIVGMVPASNGVIYIIDEVLLPPAK
jgi:uncharacterized surface protein with fasciclin (FAS1) repeats